MPAKPNPIDDYLAKVNVGQRTALQKLCKTIRAAAPKAEVGVSYGLPAFFSDGKPLVAFSASAKHCSLFPMNGATVTEFKDDLKGFDTSKGTIRFTVDQPLPAALVRKIVKARLAENAERDKASTNKTADAPNDPGVVAFFREMKHPLKKEIEAVRKIILGVSPEIREGIKWNSPSFRTTEWFATLNLREGRVWLILHTGAKAKGKTVQAKIAEPTGMLKWLGQDRALVTFENGADLASKRKALEAIVREWVRHV